MIHLFEQIGSNSVPQYVVILFLNFLFKKNNFPAIVLSRTNNISRCKFNSLCGHLIKQRFSCQTILRNYDEVFTQHSQRSYSSLIFRIGYKRRKTRPARTVYIYIS